MSTEKKRRTFRQQSSRLIYEKNEEVQESTSKRVTIKPLIGHPDRKHISTSYVERQNLTMRMQMRRFKRLTNAFSKKLVNLEAALALHFYHYNFMRIHQSLRVTPAMEARVTTKHWSWEDLLNFGMEQKAA